MAWHNAYNGIPTVRTQKKRLLQSTYEGNCSSDAYFDDHSPNSLDHIDCEIYSGKIDLSIIIKSPTVTGHRDKYGRIVVPSFIGEPEGAQNSADAIIPATALKGMLASAYEAVSESRLRVFSDHSHPLTYRRQLAEATKLVPVFLRRTPGRSGATEPSWRAELMFGHNGTSTGEPPAGLDYICAAYLPDSPDADISFHSSGPELEELLSDLRKKMPHMEEVSFQAAKSQFFKQERVVVQEISKKRDKGSNIRIGVVRSRRKDGKTEKVVERKAEIVTGSTVQVGYVVRTTPPLAANDSDNSRTALVDTKRSEFIFYNAGKRRTVVDVDKELVDALIEVLYSSAMNYEQSANEEEAPLPNMLTWQLMKYIGDSPNRSLTRHAVYQFLIEQASTSQSERNNPGVPLFATARKSHDSWIITSLSATTAGRSMMTGTLSPKDLAELGGGTTSQDWGKAAPHFPMSVYPPQRLEEASPADRLWGFVPQQKDETSFSGLRGRIVLSCARPAAPEPRSSILAIKPAKKGFGPNDQPGWIPPILASPKPSTAQPYLRDGEGHSLTKTLTRGSCYKRGQTLIRKTYPTHRFLTDRGTVSPHLLQDSAERPSLDSTEVKVGSYLKPKARFIASLRFEGLNREELAVLLWLLDPKNLVPAPDSKKKGYLHIGLGKPYGLGAIEVTGTPVQVETGEQIAKRYRTLDWTNDYTALNAAEVRSSLPRQFTGADRSLAVRSFVRSCYGWPRDHTDRTVKRHEEDTDTVSYYPPDYADSKDLSPIITFFTDSEESRANGEEPKVSIVALEEDSNDLEITSASSPTALMLHNSRLSTSRPTPNPETGDAPKPRRTTATPATVARQIRGRSR